MRIAVCDAQSMRREQLCQTVQLSMNGYAVSYILRQYADTAKLLCDIEEGEYYDIIFWDAGSAAHDNGALITAVHQKRCATHMILTSNDALAAVDGYEWGADGFLLWPYDVPHMHRLLSRLLRDTGWRCLTVHRHRTITRVPFEDILYVESRNTRCIIHCRQAVEYIQYVHLDDIEKRLCDPRFLRCHQSYLVNMDHVVRVDTHFEVGGGAVVAIRQRDLRRIRERYLAYVEATENRENMNRV